MTNDTQDTTAHDVTLEDAASGSHDDAPDMDIDPAPRDEAPLRVFTETIDMEVLNHLLFHKAIGEGGINIDKYLGILRGISEGDHMTMEDPKDRTTALVFELVIQEDFNPWDIDLKRFARSYLKRLTGDLDFITAGRLIFMAFKVLRLQSTELLEESLSEPYDDYDDYMEIEDWMEEDASYIYTRRVVEAKNPPIDESIMRRGNRPVTLYELMEAFNEAAEESVHMREHNLRMKEERRRLDRLRQRNRQHVGDKVHDEDYKVDIDKVHSALLKLKTRRINFSQLTPISPTDEITTFIALLFLNFEEMIEIKQKDFPRGEIVITIPEPADSTLIAAAVHVPHEMATEA